jgi:hypothetical protein
MYHTQEFGVRWKNKANIIFYRNFNTDFEGLLAFTRTIFKTSTYNSAIVDVEADSDNYNIYTDPQIMPTEEINFDEEVMESIRLYVEYIQDLFDDGSVCSFIGTEDTVNNVIYFSDGDVKKIGFDYEGSFLELYINNEIVESSDFIRDFIRQIEDESVKTVRVEMNGKEIAITKL